MYSLIIRLLYWARKAERTHVRIKKLYTRGTRFEILSKRFQLGSIILSPLAHEKLLHPSVVIATEHHRNGDWGDEHLTEAEWKQNNDSLLYGGTITSRYISGNDEYFRVTTEADRQTTNIYMEDEL